MFCPDRLYDEALKKYKMEPSHVSLGKLCWSSWEALQMSPPPSLTMTATKKKPSSKARQTASLWGATLLCLIKILFPFSWNDHYMSHRYTKYLYYSAHYLDTWNVSWAPVMTCSRWSGKVLALLQKEMCLHNSVSQMWFSLGQLISRIIV